jgi:hypothetical protein
MVWQYVVPAAIGLIASSQKAQATTSAAQTEAAATMQAADVQRQIFERQVQLQEPWRKAGEQALNKLIPLSTEYTPFGMQQFQADPGYAFRLSEGQKALERSAAARGGLISGNALRATQQYGQEMGSQEYMNAFKRYQTEREAQLNPLQSLAGVGQTSAARLSEASQAYGSNVGKLLTDQGKASGQAQLARASAYGEGLQGISEIAGRYFGDTQKDSKPSYAWG